MKKSKLMRVWKGHRSITVTEVDQ